jgi:hypothetical protein
LRSLVANRPPSSGTSGRRSGGNHGDDLEDHPLGSVPAVLEGVHDLQALGDLLALRFAGGLAHLAAQVDREVGDAELAQQLVDRLGAHPDLEVLFAVLIAGVGVLVLAEHLRDVERRRALVDDDVRNAVEHLLDVLQGDVEQVADAARQALQEPDVRDLRGEVDVAEALTPHAALNDLDPTLLADDTAVLHALVLAAEALVVLHRPEDLRAEEAFALRLEGPVVDRLRLLHLAVGPRTDLVRARQRDANRAEAQGILRLLEEVEDVLHGFSSREPRTHPGRGGRIRSARSR